MLAKRVIACLDVKDGRVVKGINFLGLRDAGDPAELAAAYNVEGVDEVVFLDITASAEKRGLIVETVARTSRKVFIPLTVGGGIRSVADARAILTSGADKVSVNTAAVEGPELITALSEEFGSQAVVLAIDARRYRENDAPAENPGAAGLARLYIRRAQADQSERRRVGHRRRGLRRRRNPAHLDGL